MLDILSKIFEYIFPSHPSILKIKNETPATFVRFLKLETYQACIVLSEYRNPIINSAIKANKFHNDNHASQLLVELIKNWLKTLPVKHTILIPMPLSRKRKEERGYNQVFQILKHLQNEPNTSIETEVLIKIKDTPPQSKMGRQKRLENVTDVFKFVQNNKITNDIRIILVDDVITTGATMKSSSTVLKSNLPTDCELICLAIAH